MVPTAAKAARSGGMPSSGQGRGGTGVPVLSRLQAEVLEELISVAPERLVH